MHVSSAAMVKVPRSTGKVSYILITRPGVKQSIEGLAHDADVLGRYFSSSARPLELRLFPNTNRWAWAVLGIYAAIGLAAGVGGGELLHSKSQEQNIVFRYFLDAFLGAFSSLIFPAARILFESNVHHPVLRMRAASQMNVSSYLFGPQAVISVNDEFRKQQVEEAAELVHSELEKSGVVVDPETFYSAFSVIQQLGIDKAEEVTPVTKVPLEEILRVVKTHPGLLPVHA